MAIEYDPIVPLGNLKHEKFCQAVARGESIRQAYYDAGFKPKDRVAAGQYGYALKKKAQIQARIAYLESVERSEVTEDHEVTREYLTKRLKKGFEHALGEMVSKDKIQAGATAVAFCRELSELMGFKVKRSESISIQARVNELTDAQLEKLIAAKRKELGPDIDGIGRSLAASRGSEIVVDVGGEPAPGVPALPETTGVSQPREEDAGTPFNGGEPQR